MPAEIAAPAADSPATIEERGHDVVADFLRASKSSGLIVIEVGNGRRTRVNGDFDAEALGRVIDVLDRRRRFQFRLGSGSGSRSDERT